MPVDMVKTSESNEADDKKNRYVDMNHVDGEVQ